MASGYGKDRFGFDKHHSGTQFWNRPTLTRRHFFRHASAAVGGYFLLPELNTETVARAQAPVKATAKQCIFILMRGGPSQVDTFDLKTGSWTPSNLGPESINGIQWPRGLMPKMAGHLGDAVLLRSMRAWAAVHGLAQVWMQIGRNPTSAAAKIAPHIGSVVSLELGGNDPSAVFPAFLSLNAGSGVGGGYLPPKHAPFFATPGGGGLLNSTHSAGNERFDRRYNLLLELDAELREKPELGAAPYETQAYNAAARRMIYSSKVDEVFRFPQSEITRYGSSAFGNSCIVARNLIRANAGVRFVQIQQPEWDHHADIWTANAGHYRAGKQFDDGLGSLIEDLKADGTFNETLIVAMGEFGRTTGPLNAGRGRDHLLQQAGLITGAGIRGGRAIGQTNTAGSGTMEPQWSGERDIKPEDIEATIYSALGIDWTTIRRDDPFGRGFEYVPRDNFNYRPIDELWG